MIPGVVEQTDGLASWLAEVRGRVERIASDVENEIGGPESHPPSGIPISPMLGAILERIIREFDVHRVLEFGAGKSSVRFAAALERQGGGMLVSVEQDPAWCAEQWAAVVAMPRVHSRMLVDTPKWCMDRSGAYMGFRSAASALRTEAPFDLILVDAPQSYYGRDGPLHIAAQLVRRGSFIVLDDVHRMTERATLSRILNSYSGLYFCWRDARADGSRAAMLVSDGSTAPRFRIATYVSGCMWSLWLALRRGSRRLRGMRY